MPVMYWNISPFPPPATLNSPLPPPPATPQPPSPPPSLPPLTCLSKVCKHAIPTGTITLPCSQWEQVSCENGDFDLLAVCPQCGGCCISPSPSPPPSPPATSIESLPPSPSPSSPAPEAVSG